MSHAMPWRVKTKVIAYTHIHVMNQDDGVYVCMYVCMYVWERVVIAYASCGSICQSFCTQPPPLPLDFSQFKFPKTHHLCCICVYVCVSWQLLGLTFASPALMYQNLCLGNPCRGQISSLPNSVPFRETSCLISPAFCIDSACACLCDLKLNCFPL